MFFHLLYSRHADAPPPAHQTVTMTRQQLRTGKVSSRYGGYVCFHCLLNICATLNSRFTPHPCPPPFHPPASMSRIRVCTPVGLRSRFAAEVSQQSTSVGVYVVQPWVWMVMFFFLFLLSVGLIPCLRPSSSSRQSDGHHQGMSVAQWQNAQ